MPGIIWIAAAVAILVSALLELLATVPAKKFFSRLLSVIALLFLALAAGIVLGVGINLFSVGFAILAVYRGVNTCRIITGRLQKNNLRRATWRAGWVLFLAQILVLAADCYWQDNIDTKSWVLVLAASQLGVALAFLVSFNRQARLARFLSKQVNTSNRDLPTLTVAVPAKNETAELEKCLESLLASDYPKLEVLVLDDAAGNKTGDIINALAHDGVRFILGEPPEGRWLPKNLAYDRLASEANGELILFCGVDARFDRTSLRALVQELLAGKTQMLSVMPINTQQPLSLVVQPMRYFWELARPRFGASLPVLSTCWMIERQELVKAGGLSAVKSEIVPERYFASYSAAHGGYKFVRGNRQLGITSVKSPLEQRQTAIRTRYPLLHHRLATVAGTSLFNVFYLLGPLVVLVYVSLINWSLLTEILAGLAAATWVVIYAAILRASFRIGAWAAPAFFLAALTDLLLANLSMVKYEFGKVLWKGHDVASRH